MRNYRLTEAREKAGLTQEELAERVGVGRTHITNIETGHRRPRLLIAERICKVLGKGLDFLFGSGVASGDTETTESGAITGVGSP